MLIYEDNLEINLHKWLKFNRNLKKLYDFKYLFDNNLMKNLINYFKIMFIYLWIDINVLINYLKVMVIIW